jgi:membrane protein YqaA with SNARE-associated domain
MSLASIAAVAFIGTVFWVASPEAATALAGAQHRWSLLAIGLAAAGGQSIALLGLYFFGGQLRRHWSWFDRQCARARSRSPHDNTQRYATGVVVTAGLLGFPPVSVTATLLSGVAPRPLQLLPLMLVLRLVRFIALGWAGARFGWRLPW